MRRREFITLLGGAAATWPMAARAQQPVPVVGFLNLPSAKGYERQTSAFHQGLNDAGYVEGRNVTVEYRWADGQSERLPLLADELVRHQVAVIALGGITVALVAKAATTTIPIVFQVGVDPVQAGLAGSLNRPGGNLTGVSDLSVQLGPKRLELLHELLPTTTHIALLVNANNSNAESQTKDVEAAARSLGLQLHIVSASNERDFEMVFTNFNRLQIGALVVGNDGLFIAQRERLAALAVRHAMPTICYTREFAAAGGLMSYGGNLTDQFRQVGVYTGRILNGERPADLPVQQTTKVELIINLKTSKALGINFPLTLLGRADEVIE